MHVVFGAKQYANVSRFAETAFLVMLLAWQHRMDERHTPGILAERTSSIQIGTS